MMGCVSFSRCLFHNTGTGCGSGGGGGSGSASGSRYEMCSVQDVTNMVVECSNIYVRHSLATHGTPSYRKTVVQYTERVH